MHNIAEPGRWRVRDTAAALLLALASAAFVVWQNAHRTVLWDASYTLETSTRIAMGQVPYRDFPLAHAPLTFLIQALLIRLTGRVFWHAVAWAAVSGALSTFVAWRIALSLLRERSRHAWTMALLLSAPLIFLSTYGILSFPSYDCDCILFVLIFLFAWLRWMRGEFVAGSAWRGPYAAGALLVPPLFAKQNIGLPLAACALGIVFFSLLYGLLARHSDTEKPLDPERLLVFLGGFVSALGAALLALQSTVGLANYLHWTIRFAAARRLPGLAAMLTVYDEPALRWELPCVGTGLALLRFLPARRWWMRLPAMALLLAPFAWTLAGQYLGDDAEDRATSLLSLWPLLLIFSLLLAGIQFLRRPSTRAAVPLLVLAAMHGAFLSQQLWGSTYALWPLLSILLAALLAAVCFVEQKQIGEPRTPTAFTLAAAAGVTLLVCGSLYATSAERLSYAQVWDAPVRHSTLPALKGMAVGGEYLPEFEELLRFAAAEIQRDEGVILLPGEDPFYFATGRKPQFPVLLFDPATDPFSPAELAAEARRCSIRWLVVKTHLQLTEDPTPERDRALAALMPDFHPYRTLHGYEIYRRVEQNSTGGLALGE
jgi:hypothetical protein